MESLPPASSWRHWPILLQADGKKGTTSCRIQGKDSKKGLPLGIPIEFESTLFKGKILFRFKNVSSDDQNGHESYFEGRKRLVQFVVQGNFKKKLRMDEIYVGDQYEKPLKGLPPSWLMKHISAFFNGIVPGAIIDLASDKPKVLTSYCGSMQTFRKDLHGEEPDIQDINIEEDTSRIVEMKFKSSSHRRDALRNPKNSSKLYFDTKHIYTFDSYDNIMDIGSYHCCMGILGKFDLTKTLNGQSMALGAMTKKGEWLFRFHVHHERNMNPQGRPCVSSKSCSERKACNPRKTTELDRGWHSETRLHQKNMRRQMNLQPEKQSSELQNLQNTKQLSDHLGRSEHPRQERNLRDKRKARKNSKIRFSRAA